MPQLNAPGLNLEITITEDGSPLDISGASAMEVRFYNAKKGNGPDNPETVSAQFKTDGSDGVILATLPELDEPLRWVFWAAVTLGGQTWPTEKASFHVEE